MSTKGSSINLFDFDGTIYRGDSSLDFYLFCLRKQPKLAMYMPLQMWHLLLFLLHIESRSRFKAGFFVFLQGINDINGKVEMFWKSHHKNIFYWYQKADHSKDVIISASPEFLLDSMAKKLKARALIGTRMDARTGAIEGENCRGQEKLVRLKKEFPDAEVKKAYSNSRIDMPILNLAKEKYLVRGKKVTRL